MTSAVVEYPESLPAPMGGKITPAERRLISSVAGRPNYRSAQRDYLGTREVSFIYTPAQAEIFRDWWAKWLSRGAGWFVADWPLLPQRIGNVFRFTKPPTWALEGGTINGQGYWRVSATVEIRGRGMLPELPVYSVSSKIYPVLEIESIDLSTGRIWPQPSYYWNEAIGLGAVVIAASSVQTIYSTYNMEPEGVNLSAKVTGGAGTVIIYSTYNMEPEGINLSAKVTGGSSVSVPSIRYDNYEPEGVNLSAKVTTGSGTSV